MDVGTLSWMKQNCSYRILAILSNLTGQEKEIFDDEEKSANKVFFTSIDSVIDGLSRRFKSVEDINKLFPFLWTY